METKYLTYFVKEGNRLPRMPRVVSYTPGIQFCITYRREHTNKYLGSELIVGNEILVQWEEIETYDEYLEEKGKALSGLLDELMHVGTNDD